MPELPGFSNQLLLKSSHQFGRGAGETKGKTKATNKIEAARSFTWRPTKQSCILPPGPVGIWTGGPEGRDPTANLQISAVIAGSNGNLQLGRSLISRLDRNPPDGRCLDTPGRDFLRLYLSNDKGITSHGLTS